MRQDVLLGRESRQAWNVELETALRSCVNGNVASEFPVAGRRMFLQPTAGNPLLSCWIHTPLNLAGERALLSLLSYAVLNLQHFSASMILDERRHAMIFAAQLQDSRLDSLLAACEHMVNQAEVWEHLIDAVCGVRR